MGLNLLRCHIKAPDPRYLEAADRLGILVWEELPNWLPAHRGGRGPRPGDDHPMIERDYNHPSVIIWTIINEGWGVDLVNREYDRGWLKQMYHYVKGLDPTRLVVDNSPCNMPAGPQLPPPHRHRRLPHLLPDPGPLPQVGELDARLSPATRAGPSATTATPSAPARSR